MKTKSIFFLLLWTIIATCTFAQSDSSLKDEEYAFEITENTIIKNEKGEVIDLLQFSDLISTGEWMIDPVWEGKGKINYIQLRKATKREKSMLSEMLNAPAPGADKIGTQVSAFAMKDQYGNLLTNENTKGKVVVLNFWFTTCPPCIQEIPELNEVYNKYKDHPEVVFASITFEPEAKVKAFTAKTPISYPIVSDAAQICYQFDVEGYPTNIVLDKNGTYVEFIMGGFMGIGSKIEASIETALRTEN